MIDDSKREQSDMSKTIGRVGLYMLHLAKVLFLVYSAVHGISASIGYAGNSGWQIVAQIFGIIVTEATLLAIYLSAMNQRINGSAQIIAAAVTYVIGFVIACLGIVVDSQANAGLFMSKSMIMYLQWGLPISPAVMAAGAFLTHILDPEKSRERKQELIRQKVLDLQLTLELTEKQSQLEEARLRGLIKNQTRVEVLQGIKDAYASPETKAAIKTAAIKQLPGLLLDVGVTSSVVPPTDELEIMASSGDSGYKRIQISPREDLPPIDEEGKGNGVGGNETPPPFHQ